MTNYNSQKVPELRKLLQDRSLSISGNKAELIARLQEADKKGAGGATGGEDEIDWDEDDTKASNAPAAAAVAAGGQGQVANPTAVPNQKVDIDPSQTADLTVASTGEPKSTEDATAAGNSTTESAPPAEPEAPKQDFTAGISESKADEEAKKRAARAKRFGTTAPVVDDEETKKAERAKKFSTDIAEEKPDATVKGLDSALPERRQKRGREDRASGQGGRNAKRQTPDRRTAPPAKPAAAAAKKAGRVVDDPAEKAKAEARAKRFQAAA